MRRLLFSPRWIVWHLLTLGAMLTCAWLAAWQWQRAGSAMGSALNVGYGLQWPLFAIFFAAMWWRMLRIELGQVGSGQVDGEQSEPEPAPREPATSVAPEPAAASDHRAPAPSPFGPRPATSTEPALSDEDDPQLVAYNRMLAELAARNQD